MAAAAPPSRLRLVLWALVCVFFLAWLGPPAARSLVPPQNKVLDFFQDWAAGQYFLEGRSIYETQKGAIRRHFGVEPKRENPRAPLNEVNAHPPVAVLVALPFAWLDYPTAHFVWTFLWMLTFPISAWIVVSGLGVNIPPWTALVWIPLLLVCNPLWNELGQGQFNLPILLLVVATWALARSGRPWLAGLCLGLAAAIKVYPCFLLVYFACQRQWKAVAATLLALLLLNGVASWVFGLSAFEVYLTRVVPFITQSYADDIANNSLVAFWTRLLHPTRGGSVPLLDSPPLWRIASLLSRGLVVVATAWACWRARSPRARDRAFAVALVGMLLVSPVVWTCYYLLLLLPLVLFWRDLPQRGLSRVLLVVCLLLFWTADWSAIWLTGTKYWLHIVQPWETLAVLGLQTYAQITLFVLGMVTTYQADRSAAALATGPVDGPAIPANDKLKSPDVQTQG